MKNIKQKKFVLLKAFLFYMPFYIVIPSYYEKYGNLGIILFFTYWSLLGLIFLFVTRKTNN